MITASIYNFVRFWQFGVGHHFICDFYLICSYSSEGWEQNGLYEFFRAKMRARRKKGQEKRNRWSKFRSWSLSLMLYLFVVYTHSQLMIFIRNWQNKSSMFTLDKDTRRLPYVTVGILRDETPDPRANVPVPLNLPPLCMVPSSGRGDSSSRSHSRSRGRSSSRSSSRSSKSSHSQSRSRSRSRSHSRSRSYSRSRCVHAHTVSITFGNITLMSHNI